jgi:ABC transporter transmembrane region
MAAAASAKDRFKLGRPSATSRGSSGRSVEEDATTANAKGAEAGRNKPTDDASGGGGGGGGPPMLATAGEVFSFIRTRRMVTHLVLGLFFSVVSGAIMPAMAWIFSSSFTNFAAPSTSSSFLADIRTLAYTLMVLGVVAFVSMTFQATYMEMFAGEAAAVMKREWFAALMRQDMAYYGTLRRTAALPFPATHPACLLAPLLLPCFFLMNDWCC